MDRSPWSALYLWGVLSSNGIAWSYVSSDNMGLVDLSQYDAVFLAEDQTLAYYQRVSDHRAYFEDFVRAGGTLHFHCSTLTSGNDWSGLPMPAGLQIVGPLYADALVLRAARAYEKVAPFQMPNLG